MRARVAGKQRIAALTVWSIDIGVLRFRCVNAGDVYYEIQCLVSSKWKSLGYEKEPLDALRRLVTTGNIETAVALRRNEINSFLNEERLP